jgi:hypothetical protein
VYQIHIIDELYVVAAPAAVRAATCDAARWSEWFPGVTLTAYEDRGTEGVRWKVEGRLVGTAEVWLEEFGDGTIVHAYLRADPVVDPAATSPVGRWVGRSGGRGKWQRRLSPRQVRKRYVLPLKAHLLELKHELEGSREPGTPRVPLGERVVSPRRTTTTRRPRRSTPAAQASRRPARRKGASRDGK